MEKYLVVYHMRSEWPLSGVEEHSSSFFMDDVDSAKNVLEAMFEDCADCTDVQLYEYTGIQYVQIERRHRDA